MSRQDIFRKAIEKSIDGGWKDGEVWRNFTIWKTIPTPPSFIWTHDFAKALWGEQPQKIISYHEGARKLDSWQYHLQQMVIADDPIAYLGDNL